MKHPDDHRKAAMNAHAPLNGPRRNVVVIGGGIAGLASAALLAEEGHAVTVLEKQAATGGRAGLWESDGFRFDTGPSWYLMPDVIDHFFRLLGTSAADHLELVRLDPGYRVYSEGHTEPINVPAERADVVKLFNDVEPGAGEALEKYLDSAGETYTMATRRFLYTTFQSFLPLLRPDVLSRVPKLVRLLLQPLSKLAAATVTDNRLRQILGYPAVFLGTSPFEAPSMYHLMSHLDLDDGVLYPMGGFTRLTEAIDSQARSRNVEVITGARVEQILTLPGDGRSQKARVTGVRWVSADGTEHTTPADTVVAANDLHHAETQLLQPADQTYPEKYWSGRTAGPSALLLYLGVKGQLPELEHHTLLFTADWEDNFSRIFGKTTSVPTPASLYVCRPSATDPGVAPQGHENVFVLVPLPADPGLGAGGIGGAGDRRIESLADTVIDQISKWADIPDLADRIVVRRTYGPQDFVGDFNAWQGTSLGPAHVLKQSAFFRGRNKSRKVEGLYYAGSSTIPGIGIPMCLISAELLIKRLRSDTSTGPLAEPLVAPGAAPLVAESKGRQ
ncbi:phytoene desaturase family protein [Arthrobacter sp. TMT4-20]